MYKPLYTIILLSLFLTSKTEAQFQKCISNTDQSLWDVHFIDQNIGIAVGDSGTIVKSTDGGLNWNLKLSIDSLYFKKVAFFNDTHGVSVGSDLYSTQDAGDTWSKVILPFDMDYFNDIQLLNDSTAIISGYPNRICKSYNYGQDWEVVVSDTLPYEITQLSFIDEQIGYANHSNGSVVNSTLKTTDGGSTWIEITSTTGQDFTLIECISFVSENTGFRGGWYNPHLRKTTDEASNWYEALYLNDTTLQIFWDGIYDLHIEASQPNAYYACGWHGSILKSTDGGDYWEDLAVPVFDSTLCSLTIQPAFYGVHFFNEDIGWVVGQCGTIIKTTNGGFSSNEVELETKLDIEVYPNPFRDRIFISNNSRFAIEEVLILDQMARTVKTSKSNILTTGDLSSGIYLILIKTKQGIHTEKLIKH